MTSFITTLVIAVVLFFVARYLSSLIKHQNESGNSGNNRVPTSVLGLLRFVAKAAAIILAVWALVGTSFVWVKSGNIATMKRIYFASSLEPGQIVAVGNQLGPKAEILTAGFHVDPFITLLNEVEEHPVLTVPPNKCALMSAKDGRPISGGSAMAEPWPEATKHKMANDAVHFLTTGKGQRGPQTTVLGPGSYTINPHLWETPRIIDATRVEQGTVGVVKSSVVAEVDFGAFKRPRPTSNELKVLTPDQLPEGAASALLVPVGAIGVWEEALPNGLYYINTDAYRITMVPSTDQVLDYKGGYKYRTVDVSVDAKGQITERTTDLDVKEVAGAADKAIFTKPEGWDVPQELRALVQVSPRLAPFVVASLGLTEKNAAQIIEDRVITPILRSVVRDVQGGTQIAFVQTKAMLDERGNPLLDAEGKTRTQVVHEFRSVRVMDLLENRSSIEQAIEDRAKPETLKEGVTLREVRLAESAIPAELLIARKREQLAQQLKKAWEQEEIAQGQRQKTENARAQADQQTTFVQAEIDAKAAIERAKGRVAAGNAEKTYLISLAEGQKAQAAVLGQEETAKLQMFGQVLKLVGDIAEKHPDILTKGFENAVKFVPNVVVTNTGGSGGSNGGSMEGAAAIFAHLMGGGQNRVEQPKTTTAAATK